MHFQGEKENFFVHILVDSLKDDYKLLRKKRFTNIYIHISAPNIKITGTIELTG